MWFLQLLADSAESGTPEQNTNPWIFYVVFIAVVIGLVVLFFFSSRKNRQADKEYSEQLEYLAPGNKVITKGGLCGIVVEVCDDGTFVMETGSEKSGRSYLKLDKAGIYQTDAKGPTQLAREAAEERKRLEREARKGGVPAPAAEEKPAAEETPAEEPAPEETDEAPKE